MNPLLRKQFRRAINLLTDSSFQNFIAFLFSTAHGDSFTTVKQKHDKGSDGVLNGDTILAAYGPETYTLRAFKKKANNDYKSYRENWKSTHPNWMVIFNDDFMATMVQHVDALHNGANKIGLSELVHKIESLPWGKISRIGDYLGIPSELLINDLIGHVVNDLICVNDAGQATLHRPHAIYIGDKIAINYIESEIPDATDEYYRCLEFFDSTQAILREHTPMEVSALRGRISTDFNSLGGTFADRFRGLLGRYCQTRPSDDLYRFAVTVLLTFFFEQCLIGAKVERERTC
jgi:hypothetical protein